jgi:hypothetical protein
MFVNSISIRREGYYGYGSKPDASKPFKATIEVQGQHGKVELSLSPDMSARIVEIIADEVAAAGRATAEALVANVLTATATPRLIEQVA